MNPRLPRVLVSFLAAVVSTLSAVAAVPSWEEAFASPAEDTRPRCYWYWMDGVFTKEGITRDLEAMKRVGIGGAYIGIISGQGGPAEGGMKALEEPWWDHLAHAVREGTRLGVDIGLFNCPGWSQSGGPWVKPGGSMRHLVSAEKRISGPARLQSIPMPDAAEFQRVAVLAHRVPAEDGITAESRGARVTRQPGSVTFGFDQPFTARSLTIRPKAEVRTSVDYQVADDGGAFRTVRTFPVDRHKLSPGVGPVPLAPVVISLPPTTSRQHRIVFPQAAELGGIDLSPAPRVESIAEKSLAKMFQDPLPPFEFYSWPPQPEPGASGLTIDPKQVVDLTKSVRSDGSIDWEVPPGDWIVSTVGMTPTATRNGPAPPEATGMEVDKMNRRALEQHFDAYVGELYRRLRPEERKSWKQVVADSYEMGPQNWTDGFESVFRETYGYDPMPWLPVLTGRIVDSADRSNRFLWDLRRLVAERVASEYVGGLRDLCHAKGLRMWLENYGHWGFPSEFLLYGGYCDEISGEFWESGSLGEVELRAASSAAHIYGREEVFAEAWTGGPSFTSTPWSLKKRGDWALCQGINRFVLHVYIHQPWEDRKPGVNAWFGTEFNRHNTWFEASKSWIDYQRRCTVMLRKGVHVADVAYFIGEDAPKMTGLCAPPLPAGHDFDFINADVLLRSATAEDGWLRLPHGTRYRILVLPPVDTMRPEVLRRIATLAKAGVRVIGRRPQRAPGMKDFPQADDEVRRLAAELWDSGVIRETADLAAELNALGTPPDLSGVDPSEVLFTHRREGDSHVYFLSNQTDRSLDLKPMFRVAGLAPEFWDPVTGSIEMAALFDESAGRCVVPLTLPPRGSLFVVFRSPSSGGRVVEARHDDGTLVNAVPADASQAVAGAPGFTICAWVDPSAETTLPQEAYRGVIGLKDARNEVMPAEHGNLLVPAGGHAGVGISAGSNGVAVYEHGAGSHVPVLVHPVPLRGWTHLAVVYPHGGGAPVLHLNGRPVREGRKGPLTPAPSRFGASFRGSLRDPRVIRHAATAGEIARLAASVPGTERLPDRFIAGTEPLQVLTSRPGSWTLRTADGRSFRREVPALAADLPLHGPWSLRFPFMKPGEGALELTEMKSWTALDDKRMVHHSGSATYSTVFNVSPSLLASDPVAVLDLGEVASLAGIVINGRELDVLWCSPFRADVTRWLKPGDNSIEIRVWNTWNNRLAAQHSGIPGLPGAEPHLTTPLRPGTAAGLQPAGLLDQAVIRFRMRAR